MKNKRLRRLPHWVNLAALLALVSMAPLAASEQETAVALIRQQAVVIDVRTADEYAAGHLAGALNIPYPEIVSGVQGHKLMANTPIVVYWRSGRRSGIAQQSLQEAGYRQVVNGGGYSELERALQQP